MRPSSLALAAILLAACDAQDGFLIDTVGETVECRQSFHVAQPFDQPLRLRVESCTVDAGACPALCDLLLERAGTEGVTFACEVRPRGDGLDITARFVQQDRIECELGGAS